MELFKLFKVDIWWKLVLWCGIALISVSLIFEKIQVVNPKHLLGLGLGMFLVGISFFIANKHVSMPYMGGMLSTETTKHSAVTAILLAIGLCLVSLFFILLVISLV